MTELLHPAIARAERWWARTAYRPPDRRLVDEIDRFRDSGEWPRDRAEKFGPIETGLSSVAFSKINEDRATGKFLTLLIAATFPIAGSVG